MNDSDDQIEEMANFFNLRAGDYDDHVKKVVGDDFNAFYNAISQSIQNTDEVTSVLDLGCGTGLEIGGIFKKVPNASITCVDLSHKMLSELKEKYLNHSNNITLVEESYLDFKYEPNKYDYIISVMTMHHLEQDVKLKLYKSIHNSLKDSAFYIEGDYIVSEDQEKAIFNEYLELKKTHPEISNGSHHIDIPFSKKAQIKLFKDAGFSKIDILWDKERSVIFVAYK